MTSDPWHQVLLAIEPAYDTYKDAMQQGPRYVPVLTRGPSTLCPWEVNIEEQWPDGIKYGTTESSKELAIRYTWSESQLDKWPDVIRWGLTSWLFKNQNDAEKFITLYYLRWQ